MAEMSPIDVLRRYQEYETELAPLLLGLLTAPRDSLKGYPFILTISQSRESARILPPYPRHRHSYVWLCRVMVGN